MVGAFDPDERQVRIMNVLHMVEQGTFIMGS